MTRPKIYRLPQTAISRLAVRTQAAATSKDRGAAMAEYGLLIALVALAVFAFVGLFGEAVLSIFTDISDQYPEEGEGEGEEGSA